MAQDESEARSQGGARDSGGGANPSERRELGQPEQIGSRQGGSEAGHEPVLVREILELLEPGPGKVYLDCTLGRGGHALAIGSRLAPGGRLVGLDLDEGNLEYSRQRLAGLGVAVTLVHADFAAAKQVLARLGQGAVDLVLADLGFASNQMEDVSRGLSFGAEGPLDMRYDRGAGTTAEDLVNALPQQELADLLYQLGEERLSRKIARKIVEVRGRTPIRTTVQLAEIVSAAYGARGRRQRIHPATRTFLALRRAVNGEQTSLERLLEDLPGIVRPGGVVGIVSFQSLEDRLVKRRFGELEREGWGRRLTKKPLQAGEAEVAANPRSRSAKLRALRREEESGTQEDSQDKDVAHDA
jgi:16S rRNA (cytosine1402-N4)-methyltransferase